MKRIYLIISSLCGVGFLSACATNSAPNSGITAASSAPTAKVALAPQTLASGECGLFVWTADSARRFILFSQSQTNSARYFDGRADVYVAINEQTGRARDEQFPQQSYGNGMTLSLRAPELINNGTRYRGGTLTAKDDSGWDIVQPVVGLSTCQN